MAAVLAVLISAFGSLNEPVQGDTEVPEAIRDRYLMILRDFCQTKEGSALEALVKLESSMLSDSSPVTLELLREQYLDVGSELSASDPSVLLPMIDLHDRSYAEYLTSNSVRASFHARTTEFLLTEKYAAFADVAERRGVAADLFTSLAGYFHQNSSPRPAMGLYRRALRFEPKHQDALLGLAVVLEQQGRYSQAVPFLADLVELNSGIAEARLRLAVNWNRLGRTAEALEVFEELTHLSQPTWVVVVAYQEWARGRLKTGELARSRSILEDGAGRFPEDPSMVFGRLYLHERTDPVADASEALSALQLCLQQCEPSARYRYARFDPERLDPLRVRLREQANEARPRLREALESSGRQD